MNNISIKPWFPKPIYSAEGLLLDQLPFFESIIKDYISNNRGSKRTDWLANLVFQTESTLHEDKNFELLTNEILFHVKNFMVELGYHNLISQIKFADMWSVISHKGDFIHPHVHPGGLISGVFYIKTCEDSTIHFYDNINAMMPQPDIRSDINSSVCTYHCVAGNLLLWKSDFLHGTKKQLSGEKIAVSFNISI